MIFHPYQKQIRHPILKICDAEIECVKSFNFLGINLDSNMTWKTHVDIICSKISRSIGMLNRIKYFLPLQARLHIYNSLILSHINYGILLQGTISSRVQKLQKRAIRIISLAKYNAHTDPLYKALGLLKVQDIFIICQLKFYYKYTKNKLPEYFQHFPLNYIYEVHDHFTRAQNEFHIRRTSHEFAKKSLRYLLPNTLNNTPNNIMDKVHTHSQQGYTTYIKNIYLNTYQRTCLIRNCYVCNGTN